MGDIRAIAFDFGDTLCRWGQDQYFHITDSAAAKLHEFVSGHDFETVRQTYFTVRDADCAVNLPMMRENDLPDIYRRTLRRLGADPAEGQMSEVIGAHIAAFVDVSTRVPDGLHAMLDRLSNRYRLAVLSNYPISECIRLSLRQLGLSQIMETILVSGDLGIIKPSKRIFGELLSSLGLSPEHVLYVGDDWTADIVGACSSGMPCVYITNGRIDGDAWKTNNVYGVHMRKALESPEFSGWQEARPLAALNSVLELERYLEELQA